MRVPLYFFIVVLIHGPVLARHAVAVSEGIVINPSVRGQNPYRNGTGPFRQQTFAISVEATARGPAGGLDADTYDWRDVDSGVWNTGDQTTTLEFLEYCRDYSADPFFTANLIGGGDRDSSGAYYCQPDLQQAVSLAADWVRYTNVILQDYLQGDIVADSEDRRILNSISNWNGKDQLLAPQAIAVPKVEYWEIGNEPEVSGVSGFIYNHYTSPVTYDQRYQAIINAMLDVDPTLKVGPCIIDPSDENGSAAYLRRLAAWPQNQIDFVSYHQYHWGLQWAYTTYADNPDADQQHPNNELYTTGLMQMKTYLTGHARAVRSILSDYGRNAEVRVSEWSPTQWYSPVSLQLSMAQALGIVEGVFTFAELNIDSANFWEWPGGKPSTYAMYEALRDYMGDTLVEDMTDWDNDLAQTDWRTYITQDSQTKDLMIWGLNFNEIDSVMVELSLDQWGYELEKATLKRYGVLDGDTSLLSLTGLGWYDQDITAGFDSSTLNLLLNDSEVTLLVLEAGNPVPELSSLLLFSVGGIFLNNRRTKKRWN